MRELYCITCPTGCLITVTEDSAGPVVEGNACKRGADFAIAELTNPMRSLTTTVRTTFPGVPVLPVRTDGEIPKGKIREVMDALNSIVIRRPLECGDTVMGNAAGTGIRIIATSNVLRYEAEQISKQDSRSKDAEPQSAAGRFFSSVRDHPPGTSVFGPEAEDDATEEGADGGVAADDKEGGARENEPDGSDKNGDGDWRRKRTGHVHIRLPK